MDSSSAELKKAITLAKSGNRSAAQELLVEIVKKEPHNEMAWLWLADTLPGDVQRVPVLKEALRRNPLSVLIKEALQSLLVIPGEDAVDAVMIGQVSDQASDELDGEADLDEPDLQRKVLSVDTAKNEKAGRAVLQDVFWVLLLLLFLGLLMFSWLGKGFRVGLPDKDLTETAMASPMLGEVTSTIAPTSTAAITPSATPALPPSFLPDLPVGIGTERPDVIAALLPENSRALEQLALWGTGSLRWAAWSPDGREIAIVYSRGIEFYDVDSGRRKDTWWMETVPQKIRYAPDGKVLAAFSAQSGSYLLQRDGKGEPFPLAEYGKPLKDIAFSPDGSLLAGAGEDGKVILWNAANGALLRTFDAHREGVTSVAFSTGGRLLATGGQDGDIILWDLEGSSKISVLRGHSGWINGLAFAPGGLVLASASQDATVRLWDIYAEQELFRMDEHDSAVSSVAFNPDGTILASAGADGAVRFWGAGIGVQLDSLVVHTGDIFGLTYSPDGNSLLSSGEDGSVTLLRKDEEGQFQIQILASYLPETLCAAINPEGTLLAMGLADGGIRVVGLESGRDILAGQGSSTFAVSPNGVTALAFSPDGKRIASGDDQGGIHIWDTASGEELLTLKNHQSGVYSLAFSGSNQILLSGSLDGTIRLWNLANAQEIMILSDHHVLANKVAFSADERLILAGLADNTVRIWETESGKPVGILQGHAEEVVDLQVSPNEEMLASVSRDGVIGLWRKDDFTLIKKLDGLGEVSSLVFSTGGSFLVAAYMDGSVRIWDTDSGEVIRSLDGSREPVISVFLSKEDQYLAIIYQDGFVSLWGIVRQEPLSGEAELNQMAGEDGSQPDVPPENLLPAPLYFLSNREGGDQIWRMEPDGKTLTRITFEEDPVTAMDISPLDGSLAYVSGNQLILAGSDGSNRRILVSGKDVSPASQALRSKEQISNPLWSPSGTRLAYALNGVVVYDLIYDQSITYIENVLPEPGKSEEMQIYRPVLWSPRESRLFAGVDLQDGSSLVILPMDGEKVIVPEGIKVCCQLSWNINGYVVWLGSSGESGSPGGLWLIDATDGAVDSLLDAPGERNLQTFAAFPKQAPDGRLYSFFAEDSANTDTPFSLVVTAEDGQSDRKLLRSDSYSNIREALWAADASLVILLEDTGRMTLVFPSEAPGLTLPAEGTNLRWGIGQDSWDETETADQPLSQASSISDEDRINQLKGLELPLFLDDVRIIGQPKTAGEGMYGLTVARIGDTLVIWLERYLYTDLQGNRHSRIEDILRIPYTPGSYFWKFGGCSLRDEPALDVMVMGPLVDITGQGEIIFAWKINQQTYRFDPTLTNGITCTP